MGNPRKLRQRKRRGASVKLHEHAFLTGVAVPRMSAFGILALQGRPANAAELARRVELVRASSDLIPAARRGTIDRWVSFWSGELADPDDVGDDVSLLFPDRPPAKRD